MNLEREYDVRGHTPNFDVHRDAWSKAALAYRSGAVSSGRANLDVIYGHHPRHAYDLFMPEEDAGGAVAVFLHGGYWKRLDKSVFSHLAAGLNALGVPVVMANYRLCPEAEMCEIIGDVRQLAAHLARRLKRPLAVVGHSAGAHLAACLTATDWVARGFESNVILGGVGISGIYDLRPLLATSQNEDLGMSEVEAFAASPLLWPAPRGRSFALFAGGREAPEFLRQSRTLQAAWRGCGVDATMEILEDDDHFTILNHLSSKDGHLTRAVHRLCLQT